MFSRAKRFIDPKPEDQTPPCKRCRRHDYASTEISPATSPPKIRSTQKSPDGVEQILEKLETKQSVLRSSTPRIRSRSKLPHNTAQFLEKMKTAPSPVSTSTPKSRSKPKLPDDMVQILKKLETLEIKIQDRCETMDGLCRDYTSSPDDGFCSTRSSSPPAEEEQLALTPIFERPLSPKGYEEIIQICVERVSDLVFKKLEERRERNRFWNKVKRSTREFMWPKVEQGEIINN